MSRDLTNEEFVQRLIENGWSPEDASKELERVCAEAADDINAEIASNDGLLPDESCHFGDCE